MGGGGGVKRQVCAYQIPCLFFVRPHDYAFTSWSAAGPSKALPSKPTPRKWRTAVAPPTSPPLPPPHIATDTKQPLLTPSDSTRHQVPPDALTRERDGNEANPDERPPRLNSEGGHRKRHPAEFYDAKGPGVMGGGGGTVGGRGRGAGGMGSGSGGGSQGGWARGRGSSPSIMPAPPAQSSREGGGGAAGAGGGGSAAAAVLGSEKS